MYFDPRVGLPGPNRCGRTGAVERAAPWLVGVEELAERVVGFFRALGAPGDLSAFAGFRLAVAQMQACLDLVPVRFALCIEIVASGLAINLRAHRDPLERPYRICTEILRWTFKDSNARIGAAYRAS